MDLKAISQLQVDPLAYVAVGFLGVVIVVTLVITGVVVRNSMKRHGEA
jgi:hypothetical protein